MALLTHRAMMWAIPIDIYRFTGSFFSFMLVPVNLEAFLSLILLLFLHCDPCFPLAYKRESRAPHEEVGD